MLYCHCYRWCLFVPHHHTPSGEWSVSDQQQCLVVGRWMKSAHPTTAADSGVRWGEVDSSSTTDLQESLEFGKSTTEAPWCDLGTCSRRPHRTVQTTYINRSELTTNTSQYLQYNAMQYPYEVSQWRSGKALDVPLIAGGFNSHRDKAA